MLNFKISAQKRGQANGSKETAEGKPWDPSATSKGTRAGAE